MTTPWKNILVETTCAFMILLLAYAAVSKLLDHENFTAQIALGVSSTFISKVLSFAIPITELLVVLLLAVKDSRLYGVYVFLILMVAFTIYIIMMLTSGDALPCSCGGIISAMSWKQHLVFNITCIVIASITACLLKK